MQKNRLKKNAIPTLFDRVSQQLLMTKVSPCTKNINCKDHLQQDTIQVETSSFESRSDISDIMNSPFNEADDLAADIGLEVEVSSEHLTSESVLRDEIPSPINSDLCSEYELNMEELAKELVLLELPSTAWGVHVHSKHEFIGIIHVKITNTELIVDKGLVLVSEKNKLTVKIFLNGCVAHLPNINLDVRVISDLSALLHILHNNNVCLNSADSIQHPNCLKMVENSSDQGINGKFCNVCMPKSEDLDVTAHKEQQDQVGQITNECVTMIKTEVQDEGREQIKENQGLCNICGKIFSPGYRVEEHLLTHALEKPYHCSTCNKGFAKSFNLRMHEYTHSGERPYICSTCGKTYTTSSNLRTHTLSCHGTQKRHVCEICRMSFIYPRCLKLHMRKHTGERPYMCSVCGKKFSKNIHLTVHMRTHTGEKPYGCTICGKCFTTTGGLAYHKKTHHKLSDMI